MLKTPELDPSRLDRLRSDWKTAMAASSRAQDDILQAVKARNQFDFDIRQLEEDASQLRIQIDGRELKAKVSEMRKSREAAADRVSEMTIAAEPLGENTRLLGAVYRKCAEFLGVDPNA